MTVFGHDKAPFPWFGGKSRAAPAVWAALGDVDHYVEPFAGSLAVLLKRPHPANRTYKSETVNDADGLLVNAWRSIVHHPEETAAACSWPVSELDLTARHLRLVAWREDGTARLAGDPTWCVPEIAGWWLYGIACWIGSGWCSGRGPWHLDEQGRAVKTKNDGSGVWRQLPHLHDDGRGVHNPAVRTDPGVSRQLPQLGNDGRGVNAPQLRTPDTPTAGVWRQRPHLSGDGNGVHNAQLRSGAGVARQLPHLHGDGQGVNSPRLRGNPGPDLVEPDLLAWFRQLAARLRHVRIACGDFARVLTPSASLTLAVTNGRNGCGVFIDPPYADTADRADRLYSVDDLTVAHRAREWAITAGDDPRYRIVFAGYTDEHADTFTAHGWHETTWYADGFLSGGYAVQSAEGHQQHRERLWLSPHCTHPHTATLTLFD